jgi:hypothetical protein
MERRHEIVRSYVRMLPADSLKPGLTEDAATDVF